MSAIILDTETSSTDGNACEIAHLPITITDGKFEADKSQMFCQRYNPLQSISLGAMAVHHILDSDVVDCPPHTDFRLPEGTQYLIGHNVDFDAAVLERAGVDLTGVKRICTLALCRMLWPNAVSHTLTAMAYYHANNRETVRDMLRSAHSANVDVLLTAALLRQIANQLAVKTMQSMHAYSEVARVPTVMSFGKHKGTPIAELPNNYVEWLRNQPNTDPYLLNALKEVSRMQS